ncbi:MAG: PHP domain-containing protein [Clostridia bacterium]|nr:PHP domain-containing protein [Clostridia bacterium]
MYKYETHLHTYPVSRCAKTRVEETLDFYKSVGYDGVFITNHYLDGNVNIDYNEPFDKKIDFYFSDYEKAKEYGEKIGIKVFCGVELAYGGTDFLAYGLDREWYKNHPEILEMRKSQELPFLIEEGALIIQAHPFREAGYIDHLRLYPRCVHGVEVINANRTDFENEMAEKYAESYGLYRFAGSDNHVGGKQKKLAGMESETPVNSVEEFIKLLKDGKLKTFVREMK